MSRLSAIIVTTLFTLAGSAGAALDPGLLDDFEDGTISGWAPPAANTANVAGGPAGSTRFLEISPAQRLAAYDDGINGVINPAVTAIEVDIMRPTGLDAVDLRLVLFGPGGGNRWTSATSQVIPSDGAWHHYSFSILESDLTKVLGASTYADLTGNLNRIMFRHDTAPASSGGTPVDPNFGIIGIDNVTAVPEPASLALLGVAGVAALARRRR